MLFLVDYDRRSGRMVELRAFAHSLRREVEETRLDLELRLNREGLDREVVVLEAADEAALRRTHRRYFADLAELAQVPDHANGNGE